MTNQEKAYRYLFTHGHSLPDSPPDDVATLQTRIGTASPSEKVMLQAALALCPWAPETGFPLPDAAVLDAENVSALMGSLALLAGQDQVLDGSLPGWSE